ncbi:MAG: hypothetical protein RLZZ157_1366, partial [Pseudomonadota bacterium]
MSVSFKPLAMIAVAMGTLGVVQAARVAFDATSARAENKDAKSEIAEKPAAAPAGTQQAAKAVGPPMCLPVDLAKEAGISAAEFRLLQSLQERRQSLDARERDIVTRENVLKTADAKVQDRLTALKAVEVNISKLLGQVDDLEAARVAALVAVYEKMKPKDAARIMEGLDEEVLIRIAQRMKTQPMALILANMSGERARRLTQRLAAIDVPDLAGSASAASQPTPAPASAATPAKAATGGNGKPDAKGQQANAGSAAPANAA